MATDQRAGDVTIRLPAYVLDQAERVLTAVEAKRPHRCPSPHTLSCEQHADMVSVLEWLTAVAPRESRPSATAVPLDVTRDDLSRGTDRDRSRHVGPEAIA